MTLFTYVPTVSELLASYVESLRCAETVQEYCKAATSILDSVEDVDALWNASGRTRDVCNIAARIVADSQTFKAESYQRRALDKLNAHGHMIHDLFASYSSL